jgi:hypothetical protein
LDITAHSILLPSRAVAAPIDARLFERRRRMQERFDAL